MLGHAAVGITETFYVRRSDPLLIAAAAAVAERIATALDERSED